MRKSPCIHDSNQYWSSVTSRPLILSGASFLLGAVVSAGVICAYAPAFTFGLDPQARAWADYGATEQLFLAQKFDRSTRDVPNRNYDAFKRLVALGELIQFSYDAIDVKAREALSEFLSYRGIRDYRGGEGMGGGQWPVGLVTVRRKDAAALDHFPGAKRVVPSN